MGGCGSKTEDDVRNEQINQSLKADKKKFDREVKLLLLGTGESGKSTVAKQMKILHLNGFTQQELAQFKPVLHNNIFTSIKNLSAAAIKFGLEVAPNLQPLVEHYAELNPLKMELTPEIAVEIKSLWADPAIQATFARSNEFQLPDAAQFVLDNVERMATVDFLPNQEDALRCRARTTGIIETDFEVDKFRFRMVDVGGQRSERKKWIHCFEGVTALIFCVALNEYDMKLFEDETVNRMHESVELFEEICNSEWFINTSIILFLNKFDLYKIKIQKVDLKVCFPEYNGGNDETAGIEFIKNKFLALNKNPTGKHIYSHVTCATDTENVRIVFAACKDIILSNSLEGAGF